MIDLDRSEFSKILIISLNSLRKCHIVLIISFTFIVYVHCGIVQWILSCLLSSHFCSISTNFFTFNIYFLLLSIFILHYLFFVLYLGIIFYPLLLICFVCLTAFGFRWNRLVECILLLRVARFMKINLWFLRWFSIL